MAFGKNKKRRESHGRKNSASSQSSDKITKFKKPEDSGPKTDLSSDSKSDPTAKPGFHMNIGAVIFLMIGFYIIITLVMYLTADHITTYQVVSGPLSQNETYTALALRNEEVIYSNSDGYVNYFVGDSSNVSSQGVICSITESNDIFTSTEIEGRDESSEHNLISKFSKSFNSNDFSSVYDLKYSLRQSLLYSVETDDLQGDVYTAQCDGVVAYTSDGYEYVSADTLTTDDFQPKNYVRNNLQTDNIVKSGDPLYRLVTDEEWYLIIPVTENQYDRLFPYTGRDENTSEGTTEDTAEETAENSGEGTTDGTGEETTEDASEETAEESIDPTPLKVKFLKDGQTEKGIVELFQQGEQRYAKITFSSGMIRYCDDRYLEVELITNSTTGLKIPNSAIVEKECYLIPTNMLSQGGPDDDDGFIRRRILDNGTAEDKFISPIIYTKFTDETTGIEFYDVDSSEFQIGDVIIQPDSSETYTISKTDNIKGVYCINKGYCVFRRIEYPGDDTAATDEEREENEKLYKNEEYSIVKEGVSSGISQFDFIVRNASTVNEQDILYR